MSLCVAQDCANEGWASEPVLGAAFCFGHWNEAKNAFQQQSYRRANKNPYGQWKHDVKIYVLVSERYVKIGSSKDPVSRVRLMRSGSDTAEKPADVDFENLECIGWFGASLRAEKKLHQQFSSYRAAGEWYNKTPELELKMRELIFIQQRAGYAA